MSLLLRSIDKLPYLGLLFLAPLIALAAPEEIRSVEGIAEYQLDNGLQILLFPDPSLETTTVNITYRVGSKHENYGETGMAHLLEHLVFKGTPDHPNIAKELSDHGAKANGTTWLERTNYYETFNATEENLEWALDLEADRMVNSFIAKEDLDSEMTVVRNEFERGENSPSRILQQKVEAVAYDWHNYGNSTIGARSDIENVDIGRLQAFYRRYYQPDNATLIVAGKFDADTALQLIEENFGAIPKPERELPKLYTVDPVQDGERQITLRRVGDEQIVAAAYHIPSGFHPDFPAFEIVSEVLGDTPSGRLHRSLVEKNLATHVSAWADQQREPSLFTVEADADTKTDLQATKTALLETVEQIESDPIIQEEFERAQRKLLKNIELALNDSQRLALQLTEWVSIGDWRLFFLHRDRLEKAELENVNQVAANYLKPSNRTLGLFIPTESPSRADVPETVELAAMLEGYTGREPIAAGENFDPTPANIAERLRRSADGRLEFALLPKQTRGGTVSLDLRFNLGNEQALMDLDTVGSLAGSMLTRGSERLSRQEIQDEFDRLKARGTVAGGSTAATATFQTTSEHLGELIELIHELLTTPIFPEAEFEQLKAQRLASLESQLSDPQALAVRRLSTHFNSFTKGHPLYVPTLQEQMESIGAVTLDQVKAFHEDFYGAADAQIAIVGDFEPEILLETIESLFGEWESAVPYERIHDYYHAVTETEEAIETPDKANAVFLAGTNIDMDMDHPQAPALMLVNYMLGGGFINSRLATRIRQQEGLSYGVGSSISIPYEDNDAFFRVYAISAPENVAKVQSAFYEEMRRAYDDGFGEEELTDAKKGFLDRRKVNLADDQALADRLQSDLFYDRNIKWEQAFIDHVQSLTVEDVNEAMQGHLDPNKITIIKAGDFAKVAKE